MKYPLDMPKAAYDALLQEWLEATYRNSAPMRRYRAFSQSEKDCLTQSFKRTPLPIIHQTIKENPEPTGVLITS